MENASNTSFLEIKPINEWLALSKTKPTPKFLFGEFWLEGELSILFADTGKGKSILAVQIAESIARGVPISPLKMTAEPQKVLYLDFELSDKQLEMRYAEDAADNKETLTGHHDFSPNFFRAELRQMAAADAVSFEDALIEQIRSAVEEKAAKVLIIDNITYLRSGAVRTGEAIKLMRKLKDLKNELDLSILVLAHTPKRNTTWPLNVNDLQGSKVMANFADNIFAIGQSRYDTSHRYIKHIKPRSTEMLYDAQHVPSFVLGKHGGNFLSFSFFGWRPEAMHLSTKYDDFRLQRADEIKRLSEQGLSQRQIAEQCGTSAASVNRFLQMWSPYDDEKKQQQIDAAKRREEERLEAIREEQRKREDKRREKERRDREALESQRRAGEERRKTAKKKADPRLVSPEGKPLTLVHDAYDKPQFVEEFNEWDGRPKIYYRYDNLGYRHRWVSDGSGASGKRLDEPPLKSMITDKRLLREMAEIGSQQSAVRSQPKPVGAVNLFDNEDDDACDCFQCTSGSRENCLDTNWAEQCCDGTDPDCCAKDALI